MLKGETTKEVVSKNGHNSSFDKTKYPTVELT